MAYSYRTAPPHPNLPIFCDPSHIGGKRELVAPLCQQAMDLNFDGLIVESHCNPDCAWSDASQQVTPDVLDYILNLLVIRTETQSTESLAQLRKQIDECDDNIIQELAKECVWHVKSVLTKKSTESQSFKPDVTMRFWKNVARRANNAVWTASL